MKRLALPALVACLLVACLLVACGPTENRTEVARSGQVVSTGVADLGGPFVLVDETGATVTEAELVGQPSLIYFGFTYCPDVCPTALAKLGAAQELMGAAAQDVQFILVSVDPERDTPEQLAMYVENNGFPEGLRGFTGTVEQVDAAKQAWKVYSQIVEMEDSAMGYTVDHQDIVFMTGRDGKFVDAFTPRSTPAEIAGRVRNYLATGR